MIYYTYIYCLFRFSHARKSYVYKTPIKVPDPKGKVSDSLMGVFLCSHTKTKFFYIKGEIPNEIHGKQK